MDPKRVLIVDDDPNQCGGVCQLLKRRKYGGQPVEGECAESLEEGLVCLATLQYHVIVLDMGFPTSGPFETITRVPEFQAHCPVIVMTGTDDRVLLGRLRKMGVQWVIKGEEATPALILEKILMALALSDDSPELADETVKAQRELDHAVHMERESDGKKPWFLRWLPAFSFALALLVAGAGAGAGVVKWLIERNNSATTLSSRLEQRETVAATQNKAIERLLERSTVLEQQALSSKQDRDGLHRDVDALKVDITRQLERLEKQQADILKALLDRKN